jgi:hypothetical protein
MIFEKKKKRILELILESGDPRNVSQKRGSSKIFSNGKIVTIEDPSKISSLALNTYYSPV